MFRVSKDIEEYRERKGIFGTVTGDTVGRFFVKHKANTLTIMACDGSQDGWVAELYKIYRRKKIA